MRWREPGDPTGAAPRASQSLPTKRRAEEAARQVRGRLANLADRSGAVSIAEPLPAIISRWIAACLARRRPIGPGTAREYDRELARLIADAGWQTTQDVTPKSLDRLREKRKHVNCERPISYLRAMLRWAAEQADQPVDGRLFLGRKERRAERRPQRQLLSADQMAVIERRARAAGQWPLIRFLSVYPVRPVHAIQATVGDVDQARRIVTIRGNDTKRAGPKPLTDELWALVEPRLKLPADAPLFPAPGGGAWPVSPTGRAGALSNWYGRHLTADETPDEAAARGAAEPVRFKGLQLGLAGIYRLKHGAMTRAMRAAAGDIGAVRALSDHATDVAALTYQGQDLETVRRLAEQAGRS